MRTPWGDTDDLRRARLRPGVQPNGRAATERHQRRRIFAWMVATAGRDGYAAARMDQLARQSGVARTEFYKLFSSKEECFLAAVDALYEHGLERMRSAASTVNDRGGSAEEMVRAGFAEVAELVLCQPQAARMVLVHVHEVGQAGSRRTERGAHSCELLLNECLAGIPRRERLPAALPAAIVGAMHMLIHDRLRRGLEGELPAVAEQMAELALSYTAPPSRLARSRALVRPWRRREDDDPETRLMYAIAELSAQRGYRNVSVNALAPHAKTSLSVLYERFKGKEGCFLACFEMTRERTLASAEAAYEQAMPDWPWAVRAVIDATMRFFAHEPLLARLVAVEVLAAGPAAFQARDEGIRSFMKLFEPGYEGSPQTAEAIPFGVYALVHRHLIQGRPTASLPQLVPAATFFALAPAIGARAAAEVAGAPTRSSAQPVA